MNVENLLLPNASKSMRNSADAVLTVAVKLQSKKSRLLSMQADHVVPLHLGGADEISNLCPACRACNHYKSTFTVEKFREMIQRAPAALMKSNATYRSIARFGLIRHPENPEVRFYFERTEKNE